MYYKRSSQISTFYSWVVYYKGKFHSEERYTQVLLVQFLKIALFLRYVVLQIMYKKEHKEYTLKRRFIYTFRPEIDTSYIYFFLVHGIYILTKNMFVFQLTKEKFCFVSYGNATFDSRKLIL